MASDDTQQTWRQEDLNDERQEFQENCLAEELQSGLYLSEFSSDSMKDIIQSIIADEGLSNSFYTAGQQQDAGNDLHTSFTDLFKTHPEIQQQSTPVNLHHSHQPASMDHQHSSLPPSQMNSQDTSDFGCILKLPTACTLKTEDTTVTYLNRGQIYPLNFSSSTQQVFQSVLSVEFHDLRLRNFEMDHLSQWMQSHQGERLITIEKKSCANIFDVNYTDAINRVEFSWNSTHEAVVAFSINCLSSEFTQKKHGGEKGVLLRLILSNNSSGNAMKHYCLVKVFKDKGADRKHKQDLQKREKLPAEESEKYWQSIPYTAFKPLLDRSPMKLQNDEATPSTNGNPLLESCFSPGGSNIASPQSQGFLSPFSSHINQASPLAKHLSPQPMPMASYCDVDETKQWLLSNRFDSYVSLFSNYSGSDFLRLSRKDLMDICGPADGIRMFNALHSHPVKRIYICLENETVYHGIFLEAATADHFKEMVSSRLSVPCSSISSVLMQQFPGVLVNVDDLCVENMFDEQCFIVQAVKEEGRNTYQLVLKPFTNNSPQISAQGMIPRLD